MLVFFTAEWCRYCHQMANEAFGQPPVVALSQHFVCVQIDADAERDVCQQFRVQAFPTVQFVSVRGVPLNRIVGKKPSRDLVLAMQAALQSVARRATNLDPASR
jgi:thioredoxin-like negative regulator of GroEL